MMLHIVTDSSTMFSVKEAQEQGFDLAPLAVTINNKTYKEYEEIRTPEFVQIINQGHLPVSSQPSIGDVLDMYERQPDGEILNISMADGLSGTYNSACMAIGMVENPNKQITACRCRYRDTATESGIYDTGWTSMCGNSDNQKTVISPKANMQKHVGF